MFPLSKPRPLRASLEASRTRQCQTMPGPRLGEVDRTPGTIRSVCRGRDLGVGMGPKERLKKGPSRVSQSPSPPPPPHTSRRIVGAHLPSYTPPGARSPGVAALWLWPLVTRRPPHPPLFRRRFAFEEDGEEPREAPRNRIDLDINPAGLRPPPGPRAQLPPAGAAGRWGAPQGRAAGPGQGRARGLHRGAGHGPWDKLVAPRIRGLDAGLAPSPLPRANRSPQRLARLERRGQVSRNRLAGRWPSPGRLKEAKPPVPGPVRSRTGYCGSWRMGEAFPGPPGSPPNAAGLAVFALSPLFRHLEA